MLDHYCYNILFIAYKRQKPAYQKGVPGRLDLSFYTGSGPAQRVEENSDPKIRTKRVLKIF